MMMIDRAGLRGDMDEAMDLSHELVKLGVFPVRENAPKTPIRVRSGGVVADIHHCSSHEVDPGREPGSPREASVGLHIVPLSALRGLRRPHALRGWF